VLGREVVLSDAKDPHPSQPPPPSLAQTTLTSAWPPGVSVLLQRSHLRQNLCQSLPRELTFSAVGRWKGSGQCTYPFPQQSHSCCTPPLPFTPRPGSHNTPQYCCLPLSRGSKLSPTSFTSFLGKSPQPQAKSGPSSLEGLPHQSVIRAQAHVNPLTSTVIAPVSTCSSLTLTSASSASPSPAP
jgi:hypothetical protein